MTDQPDSQPDDLPSDGLDSPTTRLRRRSLLLAIAVAETLTLSVLLVNLVVFGHSSALAAAVGPVHGGLYLSAVLLTWTAPYPRPVKLVALAPVAGAWVAAAQTPDRRRFRPPPQGNG